MAMATTAASSAESNLAPPQAPARLTWVSGAGLGLAVALLTARVWYLSGRDLILDDAYITFRYARNLADGLGLNFNPGEVVEGYTNFLWVVLMAGARRLGLDFATAAIASSAIPRPSESSCSSSPSDAGFSATRPAASGRP